MILQLAGLDDFEAVNTLACQVNDLHAQWRPDIYVHHPEPVPMGLYRELIKQQLLYVLRSEERVVAYVTVGCINLSGPGIVTRKVLKLDQICVDASCRHQGLGKKIFEALKDLASAWGCTDLQLTCDPHNKAAIALYEGQGMEVKCLQYRLTL